MSTKFLSPGWRMPRNANQSKSSNYSLNFDGSNSINCGNISLLNGLTKATWSCWYRRTGGGATHFMGSWGSGANTKQFLPYQFGSGGDMAVYMGNNASGSTGQLTMFQSSNAGISLNIWYHMAFVFDASESSNADKLKFYLNGTQVANTVAGAALTSLNSVTTDFVLGTPFTNAFLTGNLCEVCIFDYALSPSQVTTLWGGGTSVSNPMALPSPPKAYYPLGGSAGAFQTPVNNNDKWLTENNAIGDYVFQNTSSPSTIIHSPYNISGLSSVTLSTWIKVEVGDTMTNSFIFSNVREYGDFELRFYGNDNIQAIIWTTVGGQGNASFSFDYDDGKWHQYVLNYDGSHYKVYVDGVLKLKNSRTGDFNAGIQDLNLFGGSGSVLGKVSNALIHQTTLTDGGISVGDTATGEIATLYNYGSPIQTLANIPQNSNLKAWYKLDASEIYNSSSTEWSVDNNKHPSAYASSLSFNGVSDRVEIPNLPTLFNGNNIFSISCWVKRTTNTGTFVCAWGMGGGGGQALYAIASGDSLRVERGLTSDVYISNFFPLNEWVNLTTVFDSSTNVKIYKNGSFIQDVTVSATPTYASNIKFYIGNGINVGYGLRGNVSNLAIWNSALTSPQVAEIYNNGTPSNLSSHSATSNLVSWFKLSNTTTGIEDSKGSNNGTNNGATEYAGFVNTLVGDSSGMSQSNLVQSDLQTVAPYSKYALDFDGASGDYIDCGDSDDFSFTNGSGQDLPFTLSAWVNMDDASSFRIITKYGTNTEWYLYTTGSDILRFRTYDSANSSYIGRGYSTAMTSYQNQWIHIVGTYDGSEANSGFKLYINATRIDDTDVGSGTYNGMVNSTETVKIGKMTASDVTNGKMSNCSIWNAALTSSQVGEIYNEGLPSNLNSHSAYSNLVSWWQLGENSSFTNNWICADEKSSNNGTSANMGVDALTNGVATTANGTSTGMAVGALVGDAPYSTANAISSGMAVTARGTDVPPGIEVDFLVIAGGGGGGSDPGSGWGGGGGAGGYRNSYNNETSGGGSSAENNLLLSANTNYTVTVGNGGAGDTNGQDSVFATITSVGGGAGGASPTDPANNGGSGGGAARNNIGGNGTGTANQGFDGSATTSVAKAGGGGGAGSAGGSGVGYGYPNSPDADGGIGLESSITGIAVKRGGGGSAPYGGAGTWGGGEAPDGVVSSSGTPNTGGGGAGKRNSGTGASGGSGVVILRYSNLKTITVGSGLTTTGEQSDGDNKYIVFTAGTGNISFS